MAILLLNVILWIHPPIGSRISKYQIYNVHKCGYLSRISFGSIKIYKCSSLLCPQFENLFTGFSNSTHINSIISMLVVGSQFGILSVRLNSSQIFLKGDINPNDNNLLFILFLLSFSHRFCKSRMNSNLYAILLLSGPFLIFTAGIERGRIHFSQCNYIRICILELKLRFPCSRILIRISSCV